ncbi:hypothetical protein HispidOSU_005459 [Sigmodon hispidus]
MMFLAGRCGPLKSTGILHPPGLSALLPSTERHEMKLGHTTAIRGVSHTARLMDLGAPKICSFPSCIWQCVKPGPCPIPLEDKLRSVLQDYPLIFAVYVNSLCLSRSSWNRLLGTGVCGYQKARE